MIEKRPIGATGLEISKVGFGGAPIGDPRRTPTAAEAAAMMQTAWDAGIRYYDTAPFYGSGLSERRIGDFLRDKPRNDYVLSSKVGRLLVPDRDWAMKRYETAVSPPFRPVFDFTYDGVMRSFEHSLQRLGLERIDILLLHDLGRFSQRDNHDKALAEALGGGVRALVELRDEGVVRAIGAGVNEWDILNTLMDHARWDVFLLANRYTLLDQRVIDTLLPRVRREGVAIVAGAPLNSGILLTGGVPGALYDYSPAPVEILEKTRRIEAVCKRHGVSLLRAAMAFPLGNDAITCLLPGASKSSEVLDNLGHLRASIPAALWADLKSEGLLHKDAPPPPSPVLA